MIEKIFQESICISCGKETPVVFIVKDLLNEPLFRIPLCRECSNKFAEDKINKMEEELRQEAEGYFETSCPYSYADTEDDLKHDVTEAYMAGAEPREKLIKELEKENAELKEQIEKMKCCEMCKHKNLNWEFSPICEARDKIKIENPLTCKCDKWEIKENDR